MCERTWLSDVQGQLLGGRLGRGVPTWKGNKCKHDRKCDGESPSDEGQRRGEEGTKE